MTAKTMASDMAAVRNASKKVVAPDDGYLDLLRSVEQKLAEASNPEKLVETAIEAKKENEPVGQKTGQPMPWPEVEPRIAPFAPEASQAAAGLEPLSASVTAEGILSEAARAAEDDRKKLNDEASGRAEKKHGSPNQPNEEERKRIEARRKVEIERRQRDEIRRRKEEQQRQIILQEERKRIATQRELAAKEAEQKKALEEAAKQAEKEKELEKQKEIERRQSEEEANRIKEDQMRNEMERLERQQRTLTVILRELRKRIRVHKAGLEKELAGLTIKEAPLIEKKSELEAKVVLIAGGELKEAVAREQEIEAKEEEFLRSGKHKQAPLEQEKILSQRLWDIEDRRKIAEKERWAVEDRIKNIKSDIQGIDSEIVQLVASRTRIHDQIKTLSAQERLVDFAEWKKGVEEEILAAKLERDELTPVLDRARGEMAATKTVFSQLCDAEKSIDDSLKIAEEKEKKSQDPESRRDAEKARWEIGNNLRKTTQEKWDCEKQLSEAAEFEKEQQSKVDRTNAKLNALEDKISAQELVLEKAGISTKRLRDQIAAFLAENELEVDAALLADITQIDDNETAPVNLAAPEPKEKPFETAPPLGGQPDKNDFQEDAAKTAPVKSGAADPSGQKVEKQAEEIMPLPAEAGSAATVPPPESQPASGEIAKKENTDTESKIEIEPAVNGAPAGGSGSKIKKKKAVAELSDNSAQNFREPIDEPAIPSNVPVFPEDNSQSLSAKEEEGAPPDAGQADIESIPGIDSGGIQELAEPAAASSLDNRWTEIANANDAMVSPEDQKPAISDEDQRIKFPKRAKNNRKVVVQILVVLIILTVIGGVGTFILLSKMQQTDQKPQSNAVVKQPVAVPQKPSDSSGNTQIQGQNQNQTQSVPGGAPQSLISTVSNISILTDNMSSVPSLISPYLATNRDVDGYYRLLIQDKTNNTYMGVRQLFDIFKIKAPATLLNNLNGNATLFLYSNRGQNRFGFIAQTTNASAVSQIMKAWEPTIESDADGLFKFLGKQQPSKQPGGFQNGVSSDQQLVYRYIFFQPESANLGISYATYRNYFIFTSSVESLTRITGQLPK